MRPILVHVPEPLIQKLNRKAKRLQISRSELIRLTLIRHAQDIELVTHVQTKGAIKESGNWFRRLCDRLR